MDSAKFEQGMLELAGAYPRTFEVTETTAAVWAKYLDDLTGEQFLALVDEWIREEDRPPSIAALRRRTGIDFAVYAESLKENGWHG